MISKDELLTWVRSTFGLNLYEAKIWLTLLERGEANAGDISKYSDVPRARVYDVLASLEKKGFVASKLTTPIKYVAISPDDVVENLKRKFEEEIKRKIYNLEKIKESEEFKTLSIMYKKSEITEEEPILLKGKEKILSEMKRLMKLAQKSFIFSSSEQELKELLLEDKEFRDIIKELGDRGVLILVVGPMKESIETGKHVKQVSIEEKLGRFAIVDGEYVLLMLKYPEEIKRSEEDVAIKVKSKVAAEPILRYVAERLREYGLSIGKL